MSIEEIKERWNKASSGPWKWTINQEGIVKLLDSNDKVITKLGCEWGLNERNIRMVSTIENEMAIENAWSDIQSLLSFLEEADKEIGRLKKKIPHSSGLILTQGEGPRKATLDFDEIE